MELSQLLPRIIPEDKPNLTQYCFTPEALSKLSSENEKHIFLLLKQISSIHVEYDMDKLKYNPRFELPNGQRSFSIQDLTDKDYSILQTIDISSLPKILALRIADILWQEKRSYQMAISAIHLSYDLYNHFYNLDKWWECLPYIEHAIGLSARVNANEKDPYLQEIHKQVIMLNGNDSSFFSLRMIEILLKQKWILLSECLPVIDKYIINSKDDVKKVKEAYKLKTRIYFSLKLDENAMQNNIELAKYLEKRAAMRQTGNISSIFTAQAQLQEAIHLYRSNGVPNEGERVHRDLIVLQKMIPRLMIPISSKNDTKKAQENTEMLFRGKTIFEQIHNLILCTPLYTKEELKKRVLTDATNPIACLFGMNIISEKGQTKEQIPPIDLSDPEGNIEVLEKHMFHQAQLMEQIHGENFIKWALAIIRENRITKDSLRFLTDGNPIIPKGREEIFLSGIYYGLTGDMYIALHILAPQIENLFRQIAKDAGANISTFKDDDTSEEKVLSRVFELEELVDCYDNDILFLFRGMMNEKTGANIRNEIAHGLMGKRKSESGISYFFFSWVIKLLSLTSMKFYELRSELEKNNLE